MTLNPQEKQQLDNLDGNITLINDWGGGVDQWGNDVQTWMSGVDHWGERAERRFLFFNTRVRDQQAQLNEHQGHITALRQLTTTIPWVAIIVGLVVGIVTTILVASNTSKTFFWSAGIGLAVGVMVFGIVWFFQAGRSTRVLATNQPTPQQEATPPAQPAAPTPEEPTQQMPGGPYFQQQHAAAAPDQ
jgi:uncharacterized integral membrane protein